MEIRFSYYNDNRQKIAFIIKLLDTTLRNAPRVHLGRSGSLDHEGQYNAVQTLKWVLISFFWRNRY